eukprot:s5736_g3.t1
MRKRWMAQSEERKDRLEACNSDSVAPKGSSNSFDLDVDLPTESAILVEDNPVEEVASVFSVGSEKFNAVSDDFDHGFDLGLVEQDAKRTKFSFQDAAILPKDVGSAGSSAMSISLPSDVVREAIKCTDYKQFSYPWEKGRLKKFFTSENVVDTLVPKLQPSSGNFVKLKVNVADKFDLQTTVEVEPEPTSKAIYLKCVKVFQGQSYRDEREQRRMDAISQWWNLLSYDLRLSDPGRAALNEAASGQVDAYGKDVLGACFGVKSPNTLLKRYYAIKMFDSWSLRQGLGPWIPVSEANVWLYLQHLRATQAAATRATSVIEALRFSHFVLQIDGTDAVLTSLRLRGLASQLFAMKKPWAPADVLTLKEVLFLHSAMKDESRSLTDRVIIGHLLHLLYSRSRWSDLLAVRNVYLDETGTYLEAMAAVHKGAKSCDTKSRLLPIVAPADGICETGWAKQYLELRELAGLTLPELDPQPMLPAPSPSGADGWTSRYLTSQEGNKFLKVLFRDSLGEGASRKLTSHSFKATSLSWCGKFGIGQETRAVLARHASSISMPTALYSRDFLSPALREFDKVLHHIRQELFHPDEGRSGMITPKPTGPTPGPSTPLGEATFAPVVHETSVNAATETRPEDASWERPSTSPVQEDDNSNRDAGWEKLTEYEPSEAIATPVKEEDMMNLFGEEPNGAALLALQGVIDLEEEKADSWLRAWGEASASSDDSSSGSYSSDDEDVFDEQLPEEAEREEGPRLFVNPASLVVHRTRDAGTFVCGRKVTDNYVWAKNPTGFRCGRCFPTD